MSRPSRPPIGLQLTRAAKTVSRGFDQALSAAGGSLPEWLILLSLKQRQHETQGDLADAVGIEGPTLTHHLNRMENDGLVTRTREPHNRRIHRVELTPRGEKRFEKLVGAAAAYDRQLRHQLTKQDAEQLAELLERLQMNAQAAHSPSERGS
jgi:MarR family transcriptional regulator for hemolysin